VLALGHSVSITAGHVPGPSLCPGAGAAERLKEIKAGYFEDFEVYFEIFLPFLNFEIFFRNLKIS
jgi:hypothetical protein